MSATLARPCAPPAPKAEPRYSYCAECSDVVLTTTLQGLRTPSGGNLPLCRPCFTQLTAGADPVQCDCCRSHVPLKAAVIEAGDVVFCPFCAKREVIRAAA